MSAVASSLWSYVWKVKSLYERSANIKLQPETLIATDGTETRCHTGYSGILKVYWLTVTDQPTGVLGASDALRMECVPKFVNMGSPHWGPNAIGKGDLTLSEMGTFGSRNGESNGQH